MDKQALITWLNDAYGMEQAQIETLERIINDYEDHPQIQDRLNKHIKETRQQAEDVAGCIEQLGGSVSKTKSVLGSMMGAAGQMGPRSYDDDVVRNMILLHASEHFEHASYLSLISAARELGETEIAETCERIMREEEDMASWSEEQIQAMTIYALQQVGA